MALPSRSSRDLVRDLGYERKGRSEREERGRGRGKEVGELALVGSLDRWIGKGGREGGGSAEEISTHSLTPLLFWW